MNVFHSQDRVDRDDPKVVDQFVLLHGKFVNQLLPSSNCLLLLLLDIRNNNNNNNNNNK
jgi:hypothetical protein